MYGAMNQLKVHQQQTIVALHEQGWSQRRIARELGLDRKTVRRYLAAVAGSKSPTNPRTGSEPQNPTLPAPPAGPEPGIRAKIPHRPANRRFGFGRRRAGQSV